jgi:hypothetical protein
MQASGGYPRSNVSIIFTVVLQDSQVSFKYTTDSCIGAIAVYLKIIYAKKIKPDKLSFQPFSH